MTYLWMWPQGGWSFDDWKAGQNWQPVLSEQSGQAKPLPLLQRGETLADWQASRTTWQRITNEIVGTLTDTLCPMTSQFLVSRGRYGYTMKRLRYALTAEESGYAWLLMPDGLTAPVPAIIALHQTVPQGKSEPVGLSGDRELAYGRELAEQGFIVLVPDMIGFGERQRDHPNAFYRSAQQFFAAHPNGSVMGKMAYDVRRSVDFLLTLDKVDRSRIGCIGHSHGCYATLFAMLLDERIAAGAISCGLNLLRADPTPQRWWRNTPLLPRLGLYEEQAAQTPMDFHHALSLVAPRPLFFAAALDDAIFPNTRALLPALRQVRSVYSLYDAGDSLRTWCFSGEHRFPRAARTRAYRMFHNVFLPPLPIE